MPDLVPAVLDCLKGDQAGLEGASAVDCLHRAISRALAAVMAGEVGGVAGLLQDPDCLGRDPGLAAMLEQAVGLASFLGQPELADRLAGLLSAPEQLVTVRYCVFYIYRPPYLRSCGWFFTSPFNL